MRKRSTRSTKVPFPNLPELAKLRLYRAFHTFLGDGVLPLNTMAPLIKDSLEVAGSATEVASPRPAAQPKAAAAAGHLRADALSLEVPVKVHGSRVNDGPQGAAPRTEPFEEQTSTMIVFPHGCVIRMSTAVNVGQMLVVTNLKTRQDAICRTVKVRTFTNMQSYVEVEFTHKQESYWGVQFSAGVPAVAPIAAPQPLSSVIPPPAALTASAPVEKQVHISAVAPAVPVTATVQKPVVVSPAPPAVSVNATQGTFTAPPVAPPVVPAPPASASHVAPLSPPTFVPPPPPAFVAPVAQTTYVAPPPAPPTAKPESSFVWIGTQEEVQPAASATAVTKAGLPALSSRPTAPVRQAPIVPAPPSQLIPKPEFPQMEFPNTTEPIETVSSSALSAVLPFPAVPEPAPVPSLTMNELRGDEPAATLNSSVDSAHAATLEKLASLEEKPAESSRAVFGSLSGGASFGASRTASAEGFGSRLDSALGASEDSQAPGKSNNWMLIAVCAGVLFACITGGVLYFRSQSSGGANANSSARAQATPQAQEVSAEQSALQNSASGTVLSGPVATAISSGAPAVTVTAGSATKTNSPTKQPVSKTASLMSGALVEHPLTAQRSEPSSVDSAPSLDPVTAGDSSSGNALPGTISSSNLANLPAPELKPEGPVVIGGKVAEPRLVYRAVPLYPANAKQAGIQGDVVVKTTIDQKGSVVDMHVISGPLMLRQAALDALHRWKFEPSKLDGQAIAVQMQVTIRFSR